MTEQFRQHPENQKPNAPEPAAGPLGIPPPPDTEGAQGSKNPERQPLPSVWDVLEGNVRLRDSYLRKRSSRMGYWKFRRKAGELNESFNELRKKGTDRDRLILDLYRTLGRGSMDYDRVGALSPQVFQELRSQVAPMSEEEIAEELRKAKEARERMRESLERKKQVQRKRRETRLLYETLTPEERAQRKREAQREYARANREKILARARQRYHERKEQGLLPPRKKKPKQVFPAPRRPHIE